MKVLTLNRKAGILYKYFLFLLICMLFLQNAAAEAGLGPDSESLLFRVIYGGNLAGNVEPCG